MPPHLAHQSGSIAEQHVRYNSQEERIQRIERRLERS